MTPQPTNLDLATKLDSALQEVKRMNHRVSTLENWKLQEDAYKAALKQIHGEQEGDSGKVLNKELMKALGLVVTALISVVAFIQASK